MANQGTLEVTTIINGEERCIGPDPDSETIQEANFKLDFRPDAPFISEGSVVDKSVTSKVKFVGSVFRGNVDDIIKQLNDQKK